MKDMKEMIVDLLEHYAKENKWTLETTRNFSLSGDNLEFRMYSKMLIDFSLFTHLHGEINIKDGCYNIECSDNVIYDRFTKDLREVISEYFSNLR